MPALGLYLATMSPVVPLSGQEPVLAPDAFEAEVTLKVGYKYVTALPKDFGKDAAKKWPLVVFLHGAGERGADLKLLEKHGPPKLLMAGQELPAIVVAPQVPSGEVWNPHGVKALVDHITAKYPVDAQRIYLTGISMGGFGTWDTIFEYPDLFAAAIPVCGGAGVKFINAASIKHLPLWIFHGGNDVVVEPLHSQRIHDALSKLGAPVKMTIYPGVGHDSWTATYANPEVWAWLFQQQRPAP